MERILYIEGSSGISGDMTVSALLDLGASRRYMEEQIEKLPLEGYRLLVGRTTKNGIEACAFYVELDETKPQPYRDYDNIRKMLFQAELDAGVRELSLRIFTVLAEAEAKVHGTTMEKVHFHEVGAVDSIIDIVAAAACMTDLGISQVAVGTLTEGTGTVWCQHGRIPVPVPATAELISAYGLSMKILPVEGEMITPTGAAIAAALRNRELPEEFIIEKMGIGSGEKDFPHANILRVMVLQAKEKNQVMVLETNVDDCTGEQLGYVQELLLEKGALDAIFRPVLMKKSRPAYQLQVLCKSDLVEEMEEMIFRETTTIGIRRYFADRTVLERQILTLEMPEGDVKVKVCRRKQETFYYPEYEDVKMYCKRTMKSFRGVQEAIQERAKATFEVKK